MVASLWLATMAHTGHRVAKAEAAWRLRCASRHDSADLAGNGVGNCQADPSLGHCGEGSFHISNAIRRGSHAEKVAPHNSTIVKFSKMLRFPLLAFHRTVSNTRNRKISNEQAFSAPIHPALRAACGGAHRPENFTIGGPHGQRRRFLSLAPGVQRLAGFGGACVALRQAVTSACNDIRNNTRGRHGRLPIPAPKQPGGGLS